MVEWGDTYPLERWWAPGRVMVRRGDPVWVERPGGYKGRFVSRSPNGEVLWLTRDVVLCCEYVTNCEAYP